MKLIAACFALSLMGCATNDAMNVCFVKMMGHTEDGLTVIAQHCMSPEAFAESQK
jgi:hypothetical protein